MAERDQRGEAEGMKPALVFAVGRNAFFERLEVGEEISMGQQNAAGFGGGAGGEEDLREVVAGDGFVREGLLEGKISLGGLRLCGFEAIPCAPDR